MTIQRTPAPPRPISTPRTSAAPSPQAETPPVAPSRPHVALEPASAFEPGARARPSPTPAFQPSAPTPAPSFATRPAGASNHFKMSLGGRNPPVSAGGFLTQLKQAKATAGLALSALESVSSGGRNPPDFSVSAKLRSLSKMPLTDDRDKVSRADYFSQIPGVKPEQAFEHFVNHPNEIFGAAGLNVRPEVSKLTDGARLMLEQPGTPAVWFPIEVRLDASKNQIHIDTLDGHPLRGSNEFNFVSDGQGGTRVNQLSSFQLSSKAVQIGMRPQDLELQHSTWQKVHEHLFQNVTPGF